MVSVPLPAFNKEPREFELLVKRHTYTDKSTIGDLMDADHITHLCVTLEDTVRKKKTPGLTAIPSGRFEIKMLEFRHSGKFYPHLIDVPFFEGIFIHAGNFAEDSSGCILVGMREGVDRIYDSQRALNTVIIPRVQELLKRGRLWISISGGYPKDEWETHNS